VKKTLKNISERKKVNKVPHPPAYFSCVAKKSMNKKTKGEQKKNKE
jgi:hypothetical protein